MLIGCPCDPISTIIHPESSLPLCHINGQCMCKPNYDGVYCEFCSSGYYKYPDCISMSQLISFSFKNVIVRKKE